jgi:hypothetical protein
MAHTQDNRAGIPTLEIESLARCLLPEIYRFFDNEEGKREFEEWKKAQVKPKDEE